MMKGQEHLIVQIEDRPVSKDAQAEGINGCREGKFGVDVPIHIGSVPYVATLPTFTEDYDHILEQWTDDMDTWTGKSLALWPQVVTERGPSGDAIKTYLRFRPAEEVIELPPTQEQLAGAPKSANWSSPKGKKAQRDE